MTANCNAAREHHAVSSEGKECFSLEAFRRASKHRKLRKDSMPNILISEDIDLISNKKSIAVLKIKICLLAVLSARVLTT